MTKEQRLTATQIIKENLDLFMIFVKKNTIKIPCLCD